MASTPATCAARARKFTTRSTKCFRIAREAKIRAEISHTLNCPANKTGDSRIKSSRPSSKRAPRDSTSPTTNIPIPRRARGISQLVPEHAREGGKFKERLADPARNKDHLPR